MIECESRFVYIQETTLIEELNTDRCAYLILFDFCLFVFAALALCGKYAFVCFLLCSSVSDFVFGPSNDS